MGHVVLLTMKSIEKGHPKKSIANTKRTQIYDKKNVSPLA